MADGKFLRFLLFLLPFFVCIIDTNGKESLASVVLDSDGKSLIIKPGYDSSQSMVAWGTFRDDINSSGLVIVNSKTNVPVDLFSQKFQVYLLDVFQW